MWVRYTHLRDVQYAFAELISAGCRALCGMRKFKVWLRSGANANDKFQDTVTIKDLGFESDEDWDEASDATKEQALKDAAFAYSEWGYEEI